MILCPVSASERAYCREGVSLGIREDGRTPADHRPITVELGVLQNANGSAHLCIGSHTDVIAGVKAQITEPPAANPGNGIVDVSIECAPSLFVDMHSRREDVNSELDNAVKQILHAALPLSSLCVMPGRFAWHIYIDVIVLAVDGNILEAVSCAIWAALVDTRLPLLVPVRAEAGFKDDFSLETGDGSEVKLATNNLPIYVTLARIGDKYIVDATQHEEACSTSRVQFAVDR